MFLSGTPHTEPTRITNHSSTLIDNIFFNSIEYQTVSGNFLYDLTDLIFSSLRGLLFQNIKRKALGEIILIYNEEAFLNEFRSIDWSNLLHGLSDTTEMFDKFYTKVSNIINSHLIQIPNKALDYSGIKGIYC